jgi:hypothetical protein
MKNYFYLRTLIYKSSQVSTLPKAKSETRSKQNKDMHKRSSVYSERGVPLPVLTYNEDINVPNDLKSLI